MGEREGISAFTPLIIRIANMDITMVVGGVLVSICQTLSPEQIESVIGTLDRLAERPTMSPAERHVFHVLSETLNGRECRPPGRRRFEVITGGAA
jgi:hypothetical protein